MEENKDLNITGMKARLRTYSRENIIFNEPHFTEQLLLRGGDRNQVINNLINPENLVWYYKEVGKYGDVKYSLYFRISDTKTMKLPIIFDKDGKKCLYSLTYIMRYRNWQLMVKQT